MAVTIADFLVGLGFKVDDASRAKAEGSYAAYEKAIRDAEARVEKARAAGAKAAIQIAAQKELAAAREALAAAKGADKTEDAEKRKAKAVKEAAKDIERADRERTRSQAQSTAIAIAKVEAFVGAVEAMARGAVTAITSVVQSFDNLYYASGRTGTSVRDLRGIAYAFSQVGGTAQQGYAAIESFTAALRNNPGLQGFVKGLGVDDKLGGVDKLLATVEALNKQPYYIGVQQAGMLGISEESYNLLTRQVEGIKKYRAEYKATAQQIGLNEEDAAKASQRLSQAFGSLSVIIETSFTKLLTDQFPRISGWMESLGTWIKTHEPEIGAFFKTLAEKIEAFGTKADGAFKAFMVGLEDGSLKQGLKEFKDSIVEITTAITNAFQAAKNFTQSEEWKVLKYYGAGLSWLLGGSPAAPAAGASQPGGAPGFGAVGGFSPLEAGPAGAAAPRPRVPDNRTWRERWFPTAWGGKPDPNAPAGDAARSGAQREGVFRRAARSVGLTDVGRLNAREAEGAGKYRPEYKVSEGDLSQRTADIIAGEAIRRNPESIDAVINNMLNRVGSKGWGPSKNLLEVAEAPGQYEAAWKGAKASPSETEFIRSRIKAIASGGVPDNTGGANSYRAESYYQGAGAGKTWARTLGVNGRVVGGNRYTYDPSAANGPYAPYAEPKADKALAPQKNEPIVLKDIRLPEYMQRKDFSPVSMSQLDRPLGDVSSSVNNASTDNRSVTNNFSPTINVQGSSDPRAHGQLIQSALDRGHKEVLENTQSALRG